MRWIVLLAVGIVGCSHTQNTEITIKTLTCELKITTFSTSKDKKELKKETSDEDRKCLGECIAD